MPTPNPSRLGEGSKLKALPSRKREGRETYCAISA